MRHEAGTAEEDVMFLLFVSTGVVLCDFVQGLLYLAVLSFCQILLGYQCILTYCVGPCNKPKKLNKINERKN